ncbi:hypothetical protein MOMA_01260 [Moraxella macacae 0408225]|uniref:CSD domain-containing protein n=1 Tax=Moraxella macacae 0408225 TaxID=1230338 RepID=L2F7V6_9GAMM|nr:cold shock domain-containing protein [Moraxella macacae]ELA08995.1 hypothetical protein MOMA_01260 [Moraxella macacae 0408225]
MKETKYIGWVDWFMTADYKPFGFIKYHDNKKEQSVFFHQNQIMCQSLVKVGKFTENQVVVFCIRKSAKQKDKFEAYDVLLLEDEKNTLWLVSQFIHLLTNNIHSPPFTQLTNFFSNKLTQTPAIKHVVVDKLLLIFSGDYSNAVLTNILQTFPTIINQDQKLRDALINNLLNQLQQHKTSLKSIVADLKNHSVDTVYKNFIQSVMQLVKTSQLQFKQMQDIASFIAALTDLSLDEADEAINSCFDNTDFDTLTKLLQQDNLSAKLSPENYQYILNNIVKHTNFNQFINDKTQVVSFFRSATQKKLQSQLPNIVPMLDDSTKLHLWLHDMLDDLNVNFTLDLDTYVPLVNQLNLKSKQLFIKKIFYDIYCKRLQIDLDAILQINIDDYSTMVLFKLLKTISTEQKLNKHTLKYDLLQAISQTDLANHASDKLHLNGYFNLCTGRVIEVHRDSNTTYYKSDQFVKEGKLIENTQYFYIKVSHKKPDDERIICEGQLSVKDGKANLSTGKSNFWWCRNKQCFQHARTYCNNTHNWQNYTLLDFLGILNINFNDDEIGLLYSVVNYVNKFLKHLNCRSCGKLLKANGNSNYTYYRVSSFSCTNDNCLNPDKDVYLSHCSNGSRCDGVIDSRKSVKCNNGFIICTQCFACCDTKRLTDRNQYRSINQLNKVPWKEPHRGMSILCPKCGNHFKYCDILDKQAKHKKIVQLLKNLYHDGTPPAQNLVGNMGVYQNSQLHWFVVYQRHLSRNEFLNTLTEWQSVGFEITDFPEDLTRSYYRVIEPREFQLTQVTFFSCTKCNATYDYTQDHMKYTAIGYWHFSKFNHI